MNGGNKNADDTGTNRAGLIFYAIFAMATISGASAIAKRLTVLLIRISLSP